MTIDGFLTQLLEHCGVEAALTRVEVNEDDALVMIQLNLPEEESGIMIGFHGEVLEALQRILRVVFFENYPDKKIVLNINDYREKRQQKLMDLTHASAQKVLETGRPFTFRSFLPSYERFLVHTALSENPDFSQLESVSQGEGRMRRLTIQLKKN